MNAHERFHAVMAFDTGPRTLRWEFGYWAGTVRRWHAEGLPKTTEVPASLLDGEGLSGPALAWCARRVKDVDVHRHCNLDDGIQRIDVNLLFAPRFREEIVETGDGWFVRRDEDGVLRREATDRTSVPRFVGFPVSSRADWERLKEERLQPALAGRLPEHWPELLADWRQRTYPLAIGGNPVGFFGVLRALLGEINLLMGYYDQRQLIEIIIHDLGELWMAVLAPVLSQVQPDLALIWEDMAYKTGPLISPKLVRELMVPAYRQLTSFFRDFGVRHILLDTDGDCWSLIPLFLEGGITGLYPFEVNASMDVVKVREAFPRLQMMGGLDKMALAAGKAEIDRELETKVPAMLARGGYIPFVDHQVPPDVPLENFLYYRQRLNDMIGDG